MIKPIPQAFQTSDGWHLEGDLFLPPSPMIGVLISAGTGFPRRVYRHLAAFLAAQGAAVLTFDYRGIGGSAVEHAQRQQIEYTDWGHYDQPAALEHLAAQVPGLPLTHVAHSVGGHFLGLMPNQDRIARHAFISVGTGYFGGHHRRYWPMEFYFWWIMGGYTLARYGYVKPVLGWKGEPLPPKLFRTWRRWSHRPGYFRPDLEGAMQPADYQAVRAPIRSWIFTDDPIATPRSGQELLECYPNAPTQLHLNAPSAFGRPRIGHEGAFRPGCEPLWDDIANWLIHGI
jgi:predicted alpha/beta hydrolase